MLVSDKPFDGVVVRDARRSITVPDEAAPVEDEDRAVHVNAEAGAIGMISSITPSELGLEGVEGLSGIPGTVGASVVQNIGAYGQEVATSVESSKFGIARNVRYKATCAPPSFASAIDERTESQHVQRSGRPAGGIFPDATIRGAVRHLRVAAQHTGVVGYGQLAKALDVAVGDRMDTADIRNAVLAVRAAKGMLEDAHRYASPDMATPSARPIRRIWASGLPEWQSRQNGR